jgi:hypothetical protein
MTAKPDTLTLYPYLKDTCWVFDDARTGLKEEAFVLGATEMITRVVNDKSIPNAEQGFALTFAAVPFAGHDVELRWLRADPVDGNWYGGDVVDQHMEAWLEVFRAFRTCLEQKMGPLSKGWYEDGPDQKPCLYEDQPHLLEKVNKDNVHPEAQQ